jgi:hypothetical protein
VRLNLAAAVRVSRSELGGSTACKPAVRAEYFALTGLTRRSGPLHISAIDEAGESALLIRVLAIATQTSRQFRISTSFCSFLN